MFEDLDMDSITDQEDLQEALESRGYDVDDIEATYDAMLNGDYDYY